MSNDLFAQQRKNYILQRWRASLPLNFLATFKFSNNIIYVELLCKLCIYFSIYSYISGISLLGMPAEIYTYGTQFWMVIIPKGIVILTICLCYLPVFYTLQITSSYEVNIRKINKIHKI